MQPICLVVRHCFMIDTSHCKNRHRPLCCKPTAGNFVPVILSLEPRVHGGDVRRLPTRWSGHGFRIRLKLVKQICSDLMSTQHVKGPEGPGKVKPTPMVLTSPSECRLIYKSMVGRKISPLHRTWKGVFILITYVEITEEL